MDIPFGERLQKAINKRGLTVAQVSRKTGISSNTLYSMIRRKSAKIDPKIIEKICDNTDITIYDLVDDPHIIALASWGAEPTETKQILADYISQLAANDQPDDDATLQEIEIIYSTLNDLGKSVAYERISELAEIPRYTESKSISDREKYFSSRIEKNS